MLDYEQIDRMAHIISDWMNDITVPTDVPVMAICYCMEALTKLLKEQEAVVQCKDCKYCSVCANGYNSYCNLCHNISYVDGFCSEAEPKGK